MAGWFDGQVAWITGGGTGIGKALALEFGRRGASVAVSGRRMDRLEQCVAELEAAGVTALPVVCDVTDDRAIERAVEEVAQQWGRLDVAVANAGFGVAGRIEKLTAEDWRRQFDTNVVGAVMTARHALPHLREHGGRVVLVGSVLSMVATPGVGPYTASKYAIRAIGQTLSMELAGSGVTCTSVFPGFVESEIGQVDNSGTFDPSLRDRRPRRLTWPADRAARVCVRAIHKRRREFVFTGHGRFGAFMGRHMPGLVHLAMSRQKLGWQPDRPGGGD